MELVIDGLHELKGLMTVTMEDSEAGDAVPLLHNDTNERCILDGISLIVRVALVQQYQAYQMERIQVN